MMSSIWTTLHLIPHLRLMISIVDRELIMSRDRIEVAESEEIILTFVMHFCVLGFAATQCTVIKIEVTIKYKSISALFKLAFKSDLCGF